MSRTRNDIIEVQQKTRIDDVTYVEIRDPYGFIYITTNLINGKRYLGLKHFNKQWRSYIGSGKAFKKALAKYGKENFRRDVIDIAYSEEELNQKEYDYSIFFNVVTSNDWYNLALGGGSTSGYTFTDEQKLKLSQMRKGRVLSESAKKKMSESKIGHPTSEETKRKIGNANRGRILTPEHIEKVRQGNLGKKRSEETKQKISNANRGKRHIDHIATKKNGSSPILIYCIELNMLFCGSCDANHKTNVDMAHINACCRNNTSRKSAGKHPVTGEKLHWKYVYDQIQDDGFIIQGAITLGYITEKQVNDYINDLKKGNDIDGTMEEERSVCRLSTLQTLLESSKEVGQDNTICEFNS